MKDQTYDKAQICGIYSDVRYKLLATFQRFIQKTYDDYEFKDEFSNPQICLRIFKNNDDERIVTFNIKYHKHVTVDLHPPDYSMKVMISFSSNLLMTISH